MTPTIAEDSKAQLLEALTRSRGLGFLGPGEVIEHYNHALGFVGVHHSVAPPPSLVMDLGSGGGVPALICAAAWTDSRWILVESQQRRADFLRRCCTTIDALADRVEVREERAEVVGRDPNLRESADLVTARSFAGPAVTAECASPLLKVGAHMVVSEPPSSDGSRWDASVLETLGLKPVGTEHQGGTFQVLAKTSPCPDTYPRRVGLPRKRPLF